ncbi:MAG: class I SAM-dependent methyltransferase [Gammaproteobacteria bacterium]
MADTLDQQAALDIVLTLRRRWADTLYPQVRREFDESRDTTATPDSSDGPGDIEQLARRVHALPGYPWFAWMERGTQKMLWRAVDDAVPLNEPADMTPVAPARLTLDPAVRLPGWYTEWDIHLQPGGVWSHDRAAAVYELGAQLVMLGDNDDYKFHRLFAETALPTRDWRRIVDLGCGFGKSTWPFKKKFPDAEVIGIDLAAPCLRLAARRAGQQGLAIEFRQANATATSLETGSTDLVTSTMLVHEIPAEVLPDLFSEAARILRPGGALRFLDFQFTGDRFRDLAMIEHGVRNNEPFMPPMMRADLPAMAGRAGLVNARWVAFDERDAGRLDVLAWPARSEWHFPWAVLQAEKPA